MGEIVGAGLISHAPTVMLPKEVRHELNDGNEISLVPGLMRLKDEVFSELKPDTIVIVGSNCAGSRKFIFPGSGCCRNKADDA